MGNETLCVCALWQWWRSPTQNFCIRLMISRCGIEHSMKSTTKHIANRTLCNAFGFSCTHTPNYWRCTLLQFFHRHCPSFLSHSRSLSFCTAAISLPLYWWENTQNSNFVRLFIHFSTYRFVINLLRMKIIHIWNDRNSIHRWCVSSEDEFYIKYAHTHTHE